MFTDEINDKMIELFEKTPLNVSIDYTEKIVGGINTGEKCITFVVPKKLPLSELNPEEVFPITVDINGTTYKTDVVEGGEMTYLCTTTYQNECYNWCVDKPTCNSRVNQPNTYTAQTTIMGGIGITSSHKAGGYGTMGAIILDSITDSYVGLTNAHVVIGDMLAASERNPNILISNELIDDSFHPFFEVNNSPYKLGRVIRYSMNYPTTSSVSGYNKVDAALISISNKPHFNVTDSMKQYGLSQALSYPFATTSEINALNPTIEMISVGATSGPKQGNCSLRFKSFTISSVNWVDITGQARTTVYQQIIKFQRTDATCPWPIYRGDSGSVLIANLSGTWKIVGLCFAGPTSYTPGFENYGFACRIDNVASTLQVEAWTGGTHNFIDETSIKYITVNGLVSGLTIDCNSKTYWQAGIVNLNQPCV